MPHSIISFLLAGLILSSPARCAANLLVNPDFDDDLSLWSDTAGKTWSGEDSGGDSGSGSVQLALSEITSTAITQCAAVTAGVAYDFGIDILLDLPNNTAGRAGIVIRFKGDENCQGEDVSAFPASTFSTFAPEWKSQVGAITAPQGAVAALVELRLTKTEGSGATVVANLDDAFLEVSGSSGEPACGDPVPPYDSITASDALYVLRSSVGIVNCDPCLCDVNDSGSATAVDALNVLRAAVSLPATIDCEAC